MKRVKINNITKQLNNESFLAFEISLFFLHKKYANKLAKITRNGIGPVDP